MLPKQYEYKITSVKSEDPSQVYATVRVNISNEAEAEKWKSDFEKSSVTDFRVFKTFGSWEKSTKVVFKVYKKLNIDPLMNIYLVKY